VLIQQVGLWKNEKYSSPWTLGLLASKQGSDLSPPPVQEKGHEEHHIGGGEKQGARRSDTGGAHIKSPNSLADSLSSL
jgi:hypothetical protein